MQKDPNGFPFNTLDGFNLEEAAPVAFAGGTSNARGDKDGTSAALTLFTVTGEVLVRIFGICTVILAGASATLQVGVTGNTASLLALTTATDIDANEIWFAAAPSKVGVALLADILGPYIVVNGLDIIETVATQDITSGNVKYVCLWRPLSQDGNLVAA